MFTNRVVSCFREKQLQDQGTKPEVHCLKVENSKYILVTRSGFTHNYLYKNYLKNIEKLNWSLIFNKLYILLLKKREASNLQQNIKCSVDRF